MRLKFWKMKPICFARRWACLAEESFWTGSPFRKYSPEVGLSSRPMTFRREVFPQPEGPIIMINSPRLTVREKSFRA